MRYALNGLQRVFDIIVNLLGGPSMLKFLVRRVFAAVPVLFAIMIVTFALIHAMPGGPFDAVNQRRMPDNIRLQLEQRYGLTKALFFDVPSNAKGAEVAWGRQVYAKGGFGPESLEQGNHPALENTGVGVYQQYELYRWDDMTQEYLAYDTHPYDGWAQNNNELVLALEAASDVSTMVTGLPSVSMTGVSLNTSAVAADAVDALEVYVEDCRRYHALPGWSLVAKRDECITTGGDNNFSINEVEEVLRLDPLDSQFWNYFWNVLNLDFGPSLNIAELQENRQVSEEISQRLPVSMQVGIVAVFFGFLLGIPLGVLAAIYHNSVIDYMATFVAVLGQSAPIIVLAPLLVIVLAVELEVLPTPQPDVWDKPFYDTDHLVALIMPTIALSTGMSAGIARLTRASLLQVLDEDYIRTARAKGLKERTVIYLHALKNSLIPVATILGPLLAGILTGTFVVELVFLIPGLGGSFINSVGARDYTTIMAVTLLFSTFLITGNILVDIVYTWLDPRIRFD